MISFSAFSSGFSAVALMYASTGDQELKARGDYMVAELAKVPAEMDAGGYLSAFPTEWFDRLDARKKVWAPFYTIHKIMAGMFDMYELAGNKQALQVLPRDVELGGQLDSFENRSAHAGYPQHRVRRHERHPV